MAGSKAVSKSVDKKKDTKTKSEKSKDTKSSRAPTGYMLFSAHFREENKGKSLKMAEVAAAWQECSEKDKTKFNDKAAKEKERMIKAGELEVKSKSKPKSKNVEEDSEKKEEVTKKGKKPEVRSKSKDQKKKGAKSNDDDE